jgi:aspartate aminotransferase
MQLSAALSRIRPSATVAIAGLALELRAQGRDVLGLAAGEPDFDTPEHIREAAIRAIREGRTRYTPVDGTPDLKAAIRAKFARENGVDYALDQISVGTGGKQVLYNALMATLNPGDEVIVPAPYWVSYPDIVRLAGATPVMLPCPMAQGFRPDPAALEAAITGRTRWLILNSPANPTGAVLSADDLGALARVLERHPQVWVLSDDIYEHLVFDGHRFATLAQVAPGLRDRILTLNGVSKGHCMTGWRIGYAGGPAPLIAAMRKLQSQSTSNPCSVSQAAACAALEGPADFIARNNAAYLRRRDLAVAGLGACAGVTCPTPMGAFYAFPSVEGCLGRRSAGGAEIGDDAAFCAALLEEEGVALVPGAAFGAPGHVRLSFAAADDVLARALRRIARFCAGLR